MPPRRRPGALVRSGRTRVAQAFRVNGKPVTVLEDPPGMPLLWFLRDRLGLVGTKYGCGEGYCGACTVHVDGAPARACLTPLAQLAGREVRTIEGLAAPDGQLHPLQAAWIELDVAQCGYCQAGQLMAVAALLERHPDPDDAQIDRALRNNLCRCGTYPRIRAAIHRAAAAAAPGKRDGEGR